MTLNLWVGILRKVLNGLIVLSILSLAFGLIWEYSTRQYLEGFSDAIVPNPATEVQKVEAILRWFETGPPHQGLLPPDNALSERDPRRNLNYTELLKVCGSAVNAFVNLSASSGIEARRLLLLNPQRTAKHVVAEVSLGGRWVVVDPAYHVLFRDSNGTPLTRDQLRDPAVFRDATRNLHGYNPEYTYESTAHIRLRRIPVVGSWVRAVLDALFPDWEERINWTLLVERSSTFTSIVSALALFVCLLARLALGWYGRKRLGLSGAGA